MAIGLTVRYEGTTGGELMVVSIEVINALIPDSEMHLWLNLCVYPKDVYRVLTEPPFL